MFFFKSLSEVFGCTKFHKTGPRIFFPCQSLKRFAFRVKLSDSIFFLLGLSQKQILLSILCGKYCLIYLEIVKIPKK